MGHLSEHWTKNCDLEEAQGQPAGQKIYLSSFSLSSRRLHENPIEIGSTHVEKCLTVTSCQRELRRSPQFRLEKVGLVGRPSRPFLSRPTPARPTPAHGLFFACQLFSSVQMSLVSDEEYTRVHSHIEFLVNPELLVEHVRFRAIDGLWEEPKGLRRLTSLDSLFFPVSDLQYPSSPYSVNDSRMAPNASLAVVTSFRRF